MASLRVVQWATGQAGIQALRGIIDHPHLELVGLWCHSESKEGRDAGELCGMPSTGILATRDVDALLALRPDCVSYNTTDTGRQDDCVEEVCRILRAGVNVVSTTLIPMVFPAMVPDMAKKLQAACEEGGSSVFMTGIDPGFMLDVIPATLAAGVRQLESVAAYEILNITTYDDVSNLMALGLNLTPETVKDHPYEILLEVAWGATIRLLAECLGLEQDQYTIETFYEPAFATERIDVGHFAVEVGNVGALKTGFRGMVDGKMRMYCAWVLRLNDTIHPEWWPEDPSTYQIDIKGVPNVKMKLTFDTPEVDELTQAYIYTAMLAVNSIPKVCAAPPGVQTAVNLGVPMGAIGR